MQEIKPTTIEIVRKAYDYKLDETEAKEIVYTLFDLFNLLYQVYKREAENDRHSGINIK